MGKTKPNSTPQHYRNAKNGQYVTPQYATHHPATTVGETGPKPKGKK